MALQQTNSRTGQHHCRDCGVFFESAKSLEVHLQYHKENLLTKWANQAAASAPSTPDSDNNNVKNRRDFPNAIAAPADSTEMKSGVTSGPGRPSSNSSYPPTTSPFTHPQTPTSYSSAPSPYQNDVQPTGPSPSSTSFGFTTTGETYQLPYNGYPNSTNLRSPCPQPHIDSQNFILDTSQQQQENYILGANSDFPTNIRAGTPNSPSSSTSFRYMFNNKGSESYLDKNGVSSSSPSTFRPQSPHQCEKCGFICDSQTTLADHIKSSHSPSPAYQGTGSAFQAPENYYRPPVENIKQESNTLQESPDILDLDSQQKVHNFREDETSGLTASPNPHSISSMLSWTNNAKPQYPIAQPYHISSTNPQYSQQNGSVPTPPQHTNYTHPTPQTTRAFPENFSNVPHPPTVPNQSISANHIPTSASPKLANPTAQPAIPGKGDSWKSNEARRPKTYNCSACNKWFTSSGHLKRHYNTTLHKNAVKQSGHPDPATLPISSHHHPNRDPTYILSSKTPPGMTNPPPNLSGVPKTKKSKAISPQVETNSTPSPALSNANTEGDSSRSNDNIYERYDRSAPNGGFERTPHHQQPAFGNGGFEMAQTSAFDRTTPGSSGYERQATVQQNYEQRTTPQSFDRTTPGFERTNQSFDPRSGGVQNGTFDNRTQNGFTIQDLNRPASSPNSLPPPQNYDYYRDYNRIPPMHNQVNSTNQLSTQPPNSQAGPSASPSGGLPICPPSLLFLRTPNPTTIYMGENTTIQRTNEQLSQQHLDLHITQQSTSSHTTIGNLFDMETQNTPLPSFSNFQSNLPNYPQNFLECNSFLVNPSPPKNYSLPDEFSTNNEFSTNFSTSATDFNFTYLKLDNKSDYVKLENVSENYSFDQFPQSNVVLESDVIKPKVVKQVSEKECQTSFHYPSLFSDIGVGFKTKRRIKREYDSDSSPPNSPQEFPTSTNLEITENVRKVKKKKKKRMEESSNMVTSTGSPQPPPKRKDVIRCEQCDKTFNRICYLTQHNKSFHCGEKPFKCDRCGKRFHSENRAKDHSKKHGGEKPYKCDVCPKSFNHKTDLRRHLCLHTGQKPFPCEVCGKGFIRKDHMLKHFHTHKTGKKKFIQSLEELENDKKIIQ